MIPKECCVKQEHEGERRKTRREGGKMKGGGRGREGEREVFAKNLLPPLCPQSQSPAGHILFRDFASPGSL